MGALPDLSDGGDDTLTALQRAKAAHAPYAVVLVAVRQSAIGTGLSANALWAETPCIATAYAGGTMASRRSSACTACLIKPIRGAQLLQALTDVLAKPPAENF